MTSSPSFTEHRVASKLGNVYARDYKGPGSAFVLMHGIPDNSHIYDDLVPHLVAAGRRVVTFDFLGFGQSDKSAGMTCSFSQQLDDLEAVVASLDLGKIIPVVHDTSGPAGINFTLAHPERVEALHILNSAYDDASRILWPEMVQLFAIKDLNALSGAIARSPAQFAWLLDWQGGKFRDALPESQRHHFEARIGAIIADNLVKQPSAAPAFAQLASDFFEELARNTRRLPELKALDLPVKVIWGEFDPYITLDVGKKRASYFRRSSLRALPAGHWLQSDLPEQVAKELLS